MNSRLRLLYGLLGLGLVIICAGVVLLFIQAC